MKEKHKKDKKKKHKKEKKHKRKESKKYQSTSSSSSDSDEWEEKSPKHKHSDVSVKNNDRDEWMSLSGMIPTFSRSDVKPNKDKDSVKKNLDSYNPSTSSRELNPYWKGGGAGMPMPRDDSVAQKIQSYSDTNKPNFMKPSDDQDFFHSSKSTYEKPNRDSRKNRQFQSIDPRRDDYGQNDNSYDRNKSNNWRKMDSREKAETIDPPLEKTEYSNTKIITESKSETIIDDKFLSDEKMNQLAAKIVKAEILGDLKLVEKLNAKLLAAREYRSQNPNAGKEQSGDDRVMLTVTDARGNTRPLMKSDNAGDPRSRSGKRKAETHSGGVRKQHFADDDKYNLSQIFEREKYGTGQEDEEQLARITTKHTNPNDDIEDIFAEDITKVRDDGKDDERNKKRAIQQHVKLEKSMEGCEYCIESKNMLKHMMVSCGNKAYIAIPTRKSLTEHHCIISTVHHIACATAVDEDVWAEIMNLRRCLTRMFESRNEDVVFFETAVKFHKYPHVVIHCVPMPRDIGDTAPIYFKKALLECEAEWSVNKKVVDLKGKDIRRGIPKGLPYFWVDFGMQPGFAHVIEDQQLFPDNFAQEIIGGVLDLDHSLWRRPRKESGEEQRKKVMEFIKIWKEYDPTEKPS